LGRGNFSGRRFRVDSSPDVPNGTSGTGVCEGRTNDRRDDFASVYGDWDALREAVGPNDVARRSAGTEDHGPASARRPSPEELAALAAAERDPAALTDEQALTLMTAEGETLREVCRIADDLRREWSARRSPTSSTAT
jgi:hypothetical protein